MINKICKSIIHFRYIDIGIYILMDEDVISFSYSSIK